MDNSIIKKSKQDRREKEIARRVKSASESRNLQKGSLDKEKFKVQGKGIGKTEPIKENIKIGSILKEDPSSNKIIKGTTQKIDTSDIARMTNIEDFKSMKKNLDLERGKKEILSRQDDLLKTADQLMKKGDKVGLKKIGQVMKEAGDTEGLQALIKRVAGKGTKMIPFLGPILAAGGSLLTNDTAQAAMDEVATDFIPGGVEDLGPQEPLAQRLESGERLTPEEYKNLIKKVGANSGF